MYAGQAMCGWMSFSIASRSDLNITIVSFQQERDLSLYLFQNNEYKQIYQWNLADRPLKTLTSLSKKPREDEKVMILLIYHEYISLISFDFSQRTHLFTKSSSKYSPSYLHAACVSSSDHFILSSTESLSLMTSQQVSDTLTLQNLSLKVDSSRKYVNRESIVFSSIISVSSSRSFVVLVSQSNSPSCLFL
jgi:hypothetical protein